MADNARVTLGRDHRRMRDRTGLLIVRVWIEGDASDSGLRARITHTLDLATGAEVVTAAATPDQIQATVREWLEAYLAGCSIRARGR